MAKKQSDIIEFLSIKNIVPIVMLIVSIVIFIIRLDEGNKRTREEFAQKQELTNYKIDQLTIEVKQYVQSREEAAAKMASQTEMRNEQISTLKKDMGIVKNILKLN